MEINRSIDANALQVVLVADESKTIINNYKNNHYDTRQ